jgi:hypothetical protein
LPISNGLNHNCKKHSAQITSYKITTAEITTYKITTAEITTAKIATAKIITVKNSFIQLIKLINLDLLLQKSRVSKNYFFYCFEQLLLLLFLNSCYFFAVFEPLLYSKLGGGTHALHRSASQPPSPIS